MSRNIQDAAHTITRALPTSDGTVTSADFDFEVADPGVTLEGIELVIAVPALTVTHLPNADTLTITIQGGASATPTTSLGLSEVITGAGGAGADATEFRFRLPPDCPRYVNAKFVAAGGTGDISGVTATLTLRF